MCLSTYSRVNSPRLSPWFSPADLMANMENFGFICLVLTVACSFISYVTPYWAVSQDRQNVTETVHTGLLALCERQNCEFVMADDMALQKYLPAWFKATQGLMTVGLVLGLVALLIATMSLCCSCHSCNPNQPICGMLVIASLSMAVGIVIFGVKANQDWDIELQWDMFSKGRFGWSFWVANGAAAMALLTSMIYCCMGRKDHH